MTIDRTALITGAGGGLGRAMAIALSKAGARVILTDVNAAGLDQTITLCGAPVGSTLKVVADIARAEMLSEIIAAGKETFGQVDILVNNAGIGPHAIRPDFVERPIRFWELTPDILHRFFAINCIAACTLSALVAPDMMRRGWGRIVNITTSLDSMLHMAPYGITKASLEAHAAAMAHDLTGSGVTANVLVPGGSVATGMTGPMSVETRSRLLQPDIMGAPLVWLCSDEAGHVSGRRFIAAKWDETLPPDEADRRAGSPVAWTGFGEQSVGSLVTAG